MYIHMLYDIYTYIYMCIHINIYIIYIHTISLFLRLIPSFSSLPSFPLHHLSHLTLIRDTSPKPSYFIHIFQLSHLICSMMSPSLFLNLSPSIAFPPSMCVYMICIYISSNALFV